MANPNIRFPILRRLIVTDYGLFPGKDGNGLDHKFEPGVTVIPGVNGLGKTTLLNIIYRLLVGPFDPFKTDEIQLTQQKLREVRSFNYFSKRDRAAETEGKASGEFTLGDRKIVVTRRLTDLSILRLEIDNQDVSGNDDVAESRIWQLAGCSSQYDFHLLVRSVLFFLEEKTPIVWDPVAQVEIFRIIFLNAADASGLAELATEIQMIDSNMRNMQYQLRRYQHELLSMQARSATAAEVTKRLKYVQKRLPLVTRQMERLSETTEKLEEDRDDHRAKLDGLKLDLEEATRKLEFKHHQYFSSLFPKLTETAKNVLGNIIGGSGCAVCGSRRPGLSVEFRALAIEGKCPICHSTKKDQEPTLSAAEFGSKAIRREAERVDALRGRVNESQKTVDDEEAEYRKVLVALFELTTEADKLKAEADELQTLVPATTADLSNTQNYIRFTEKEIQKLKRRNRRLLNKYRVQLALLRIEVDQNRTNLAKFFAEYTANFLAESCSLTFAPKDLRLGQAVDKVEYPTFAVQMTSAVTPSAGTTRSHEDDVSESQKEFIDLAFRMAVTKTYETATNGSFGAMIVIETPESSLDSIFIDNAGKMLRNWCADPSPGVNSVIATSNLNRENMIASLLGLNDKRPPSKSMIKKRLINLLEVAAENATLRQHRNEYQKQFRQSTSVPRRGRRR
jgi:septal ring factor EnvC (AmiA/AmiB activator)